MDPRHMDGRATELQVMEQNKKEKQSCLTHRQSAIS